LSLIPLCLGPLVAPGFTVHRSGVRWLCDDEHLCRPGEIVAFCNIGLVAANRAAAASPFERESRDFQVAFATRAGGYLRKAERSSRGGFLDLLFTYRPWNPEFTIGHLRCPPGERAPEAQSDGGLELLFLAGRRGTEFAEDRSGLLTGWHDRSRAWWGAGEAAYGTLLSLGICEQLGVIRGERFAFFELFQATGGPAHTVFVADDVLVPCAPILVEQLGRDGDDARAMASDLCRSIADGSTLAPGDLVFVASLLSALQRSPLSDRYPLLTRNGVREAARADAVLLSLNAESPSVFRHRHLGYTMCCHHFRMIELSAAARGWIDANFERVPRTLDDVRRDYDALIEAVRERSPAQLLVLNAVSTEGYEDIPSYAAFDAPLGESLASVRTRELNLLLHDVARDRNVAIVDVDRIAAELGTSAHVQQGVHYSGRMQDEVRGEILRILRARGVPGFAPRA
jgi:hypothetical protein